MATFINFDLTLVVDLLILIIALMAVVFFFKKA